MINHIANPLHQHEADVVYNTYKQNNIIWILLLLTAFRVLGHIHVRQIDAYFISCTNLIVINEIQNFLFFLSVYNIDGSKWELTSHLLFL